MTDIQTPGVGPADRMRHDNPVTMEMIEGDERLTRLEGLLEQNGPDVISRLTAYDQTMDFIKTNKNRFEHVLQTVGDATSEPDQLDFTISGLVYNDDRTRALAFKVGSAGKPAYEDDGGVSIQFHTATGLTQHSGGGSQSTTITGGRHMTVNGDDDRNQTLAGAALNVSNVRYGADGKFAGSGISALTNLNQEIFDTTVDTVMFVVNGVLVPPTEP